MPRPHTTMRKIRDVLRLRLGDQLSLRQVSLSLAIPHTTVADYVRRARVAGIDSWPLPEELSDDDALETRLFGPIASAPRARPELVHGHEKVSAGGQLRSPLVATKSPHWWPRKVPAPVEYPTKVPPGR